MVRDNGHLRQPELPAPGLRRQRIRALDLACASLLRAREAKAEATAAEKAAKLAIDSELRGRELENYVFVDGDRRYIVHSVAKDDIKLVEIKPTSKDGQPTADGDR